MSAHNHNADGYISPMYTTLAPMKQEAPTEFSTALMAFLAQSPEFARSKMHMDYLKYCFTHYINFDPDFRDLSIPEKLAHAGKMAKDFLGAINGGSV